ncbi:MAG: hypothetical protein U5K71_08985 [Gracilimonas sp.]|nr:hypothetical protein [Gracilimonas sp.]
MSTNSPVDLVIPAMQNNHPQPPKVQVTFSGITYDPGSGEITSGAIQGVFDPAIDLTQMQTHACQNHPL